MESDKPPLTYAVVVNNFGVSSAGCIATSALHKSADAFAEVYRTESQEIKPNLRRRRVDGGVEYGAGSRENIAT